MKPVLVGIALSFAELNLLVNDSPKLFDNPMIFPDILIDPSGEFITTAFCTLVIGSRPGRT